MTNAGGAKGAARGGEGGKSLKDQNRWQIWIIVAVNSLFLYGVVQANAIKLDGLRAAFTVCAPPLRMPRSWSRSD